DYFPPHIADSFVRDDRLVLETGKPMTGRVEIWYTAQRLLDWFVTNKLPVRASDGAIIGVMGTVQSYEGNRRSLLTYTQIDQVVEHIRTNHRGKITVTELARQANISPRQLHRKFIEVFRMSVQEFLTKTRIQGASDDLLNTDRSITEIAHDFGFCDQSAFTQQFKKHVGKTPLKFRRQHQV
ncbi:MAG TPA: helix-turn-helix domain-containing protein, partial [Pirellulaceae bacterium]|nr:helix-turn-helix domain-containing protein [Pirellulaceae bacterium]